MVVNSATGVVKQWMNHDAWGVVTEDKVDPNDPNWVKVPFGFAGGIYDPTTKLVRFGARDYDAETGRWTGRDPILFKGGQENLQGYVGNLPVDRADPSGTGPIACLAMAALCGGLTIYDIYDFKDDFDDCMKRAKSAREACEARGTTPEDVSKDRKEIADAAFDCVRETFNDHYLLEGVNGLACAGAFIACVGQPL